MADHEAIEDIDRGLNDLARMTTAADLVKQRGEKRKVRVLSKRRLKEFISSMVTSATAEMASELTAGDRAKIEEEAQRKVQDILDRAKDAEKNIKASEEDRQKLLNRVELAGGDEELSQEVDRLHDQLSESQHLAEERLQDLLIVEDELENIRKMHRVAIDERDRQGRSNKGWVLNSTELVQGILALDNDYYGGRHQEADPPPEDPADPEEAFFHDFKVCAAVIGSLGEDLARLRSITEAQGASGRLLERDLALLEELKQGSLRALDLAHPINALTEAANGLRSEVQKLQNTGEEARGGDTTRLTPAKAIPDPEGQPDDVVVGIGEALRSMSTILAERRVQLETMGEEAAEHGRLEGTIRDQMVRTTGLVQAVLDLDNRIYGGRHQASAGTPDEDFFADFAVGEQVVASVLRELEAGGGDAKEVQLGIASQLVTVCRADEGLLDEAAVLDLALAIDESESITSEEIGENNRKVADLISRRLASA